MNRSAFYSLCILLTTILGTQGQSCVRDQYEPNNSQIQSTTIELEQTYSLLNLCPSMFEDDIDVFELYLSKDTTITGRTVFIENAGQLSFALKDASFNNIGSSSGISPQEITTDLTSGTYYFVVKPLTNNSFTGDYTIKVLNSKPTSSFATGAIIGIAIAGVIVVVMIPLVVLRVIIARRRMKAKFDLNAMPTLYESKL